MPCPHLSLDPDVMRVRVLIFLTCFILAGGIARTNPGQAPLAPTHSRVETLLSLFAPPVFAAPATPDLQLKLPLKPNSVRFAVIGDSGTGDLPQVQVAQEMEAYRQIVSFSFVIMLGDNIYGGDRPRDFTRKFEEPCKPLLDAGVKFYASLGNHDNPDERLYKLFNMGGKRYYSFKKNDVAFFALDSTYMNPEQLNWVEEQLRNSTAAWKICYFHHPLYSDGKFHGPDLDLRSTLVPLFQKYGVSVVFSGHEHVYERLKPQNDIDYFVLGNSGELRYHNLRPSDQMQAGFDADRDFMLVEVDADQLYFQTISRTGLTVDSGVLQRQSKSAGQEKSQN
jgi:hypothetical protein